MSFTMAHVISVKCSIQSEVPNVTATYWKHEEKQDEGDDYVTDDLYMPEGVVQSDGCEHCSVLDC